MEIKKDSKLKNVSINVGENHVRVFFKKPVQALSSAVLNGGMVETKNILNMRVAKRLEDGRKMISPEDEIQRYILQNGWDGSFVGMMTAADMDSLRIRHDVMNGVSMECIVTVGLSNARRAGDPADVKGFEGETEPGTINIVFGTDAKLSNAAMVEMVMMITEAKTAAMQEMEILSTKTKGIATGTGTDSIVVFCGNGREINYCGKHMEFGQRAANIVSKALKDSIGG